jgi:hypothetical protein
MNFKVCSCPKRDKDKEETDSGCRKRKTGEDTKFCPPGKKPAKVQVKEEPTTPLGSESESQIDLRPSPSSGHTITLRMHDEEAVKEVLKHAFQITAASMVTRSSEVEQIKPILKGLRKQMGKFEFILRRFFYNEPSLKNKGLQIFVKLDFKCSTYGPEYKTERLRWNAVIVFLFLFLGPG